MHNRVRALESRARRIPKRERQLERMERKAMIDGTPDASVFRLSNRNRRKKEAMKAAAEAALVAAKESGRPAAAIMAEVTGEPSARCAGYLSTSPNFSAALLFDRRRSEDKPKEAAPVHSGPLVQVRRQWNDWAIAEYHLSALDGLCWDDVSGGINARAPRSFLHGYVLCDAMVTGSLSHSCRHGPPPHRIKVCITKKGNEDAWQLILKQAPPRG